MTRVLLGVVLTLCLCGCENDSHEKVAADTVPVLREMADAMDSAKDEETAKAAVAKIDALKPRLDDLAARRKKLGEPSPEERKQLTAAHEKELQEQVGRMLKSSLRLGFNPKLSPYATQMTQAMERATAGLN